jgi:hypothetical protein
MRAPDGIWVGRFSDEPDADPVVAVGRLVAEKNRGAIVDCDENVDGTGVVKAA